MIAASLIALSLFGHWPHAQTITQTRKAADWTIRITRDTFTDRISCSLSKRDIRFERDSLVFDLGRESDTGDAYFRVDDGAARSVREAALEDDRHGFYRNGGPIENPSGGEVVLPASYIDGAKRVSIRTSVRHSPRVFDVSRFAAALAAARAAGCGDAAL